MDEKQREYYKEQIGDLFFEDDIISVPMVIYSIMFDYTAYYSLDFLEQIGNTIKVSCLWGEFIPQSINRSNVLSNGEKPVAACCFAGAVYFIAFLFPEWLHYTPIAKVDAIIHELLHVGGGGRITPHIPDFDFIVGAMVQEYFPEMNPRLKMALALLDEEEKFILEYHGIRGRHVKRVCSRKMLEQSLTTRRLFRTEKT